MNLYQVMVNHYAPKDSKQAIAFFIVANSNEEVFNYLFENDYITTDCDSYYNSWKDMSEDDPEQFEIFKQQVLENCDEEAYEGADYDELYYGKTFLSWKLLKEHASPDVLQDMSDYGVPMFLVQ